MSDVIKLRADLAKRDFQITASLEIEQTYEIMVDGRRKINTLKKTDELGKKTVQDFMGDATQLIDTRGGELFTWKSFVDIRLDADLVKQLYPHVYEQCLKIQEIRRFEVK